MSPARGGACQVPGSGGFRPAGLTPRAGDRPGDRSRPDKVTDLFRELDRGGNHPQGCVPLCVGARQRGRFLACPCPPRVQNPTGHGPAQPPATACPCRPLEACRWEAPPPPRFHDTPNHTSLSSQKNPVPVKRPEPLDPSLSVRTGRGSVVPAGPGPNHVRSAGRGRYGDFWQ